LGTSAQTQHDDRDDVIGQGEIDIVHDQDLVIGEARLSLDVGITRRFGASLVLPVRIVKTSIRYLDLASSEVQLVTASIHHRTETVTGLGDPMLLGSTSLRAASWRLTTRAGLTLPIGRTEENPFALGDLGLSHQHIQLGTGTFNPVISVEAAHSMGAWRFGVFALTQQVVYENAKGYTAGDRYASGVVLRRGLGTRWSVRGSVDALGETAERWDGIRPTDDGNQGRFDLIFGAGASFAATTALGIDVGLRLPAITHAVGGQLSMPAIVEVGASWSFGAKPKAVVHGHDDDHDHDGEHGDEHGHDSHASEPLHPDTTGLDVSDLGSPGEAVDLVPVSGKITIFDFWAVWCEPCKVLEPALVEIARAHPDLVAIRRIDAVDWDSAAVARHLTPNAFNLPHVKVFDVTGRMVIERSSEAGGLQTLIDEVRRLVEAEAAKRVPPSPPLPPSPDVPVTEAPSDPRSGPRLPPDPSEQVPKTRPAPVPVYSIIVTAKGFEPGEVTVPVGQRVTLRFHRKVERTCATEVVLEVDGEKIVKDLPLGKSIDLTLTFAKRGKVRYACAMDMIRGSITVQ